MNTDIRFPTAHITHYRITQHKILRDIDFPGYGIIKMNNIEI